MTQLNPTKTKSEEEAWLDAIESGDLEQVRNTKDKPLHCFYGLFLNIHPVIHSDKIWV